tara:strand:- start:1012 stop:1482 length:471 start_codon:yes stop_codon:yes gene_type:complete
MKIRILLLKFILNLYPPLLFNRIILKEISDDYKEMRVILKKVFFNINLHKTIFGGSIFAACDPYFPSMYYNIFYYKGKKLSIWTKSAKIDYIKPADSSLEFLFKLSEEDINKAELKINENGKYQAYHTVIAKNKNGEICAKAEIIICLIDKNKKNT